MRDLISLACGTCKNKNYYTTRNKRKHPEKIVLRKYCHYCRKHTEHKEAKV